MSITQELAVNQQPALREISDRLECLLSDFANNQDQMKAALSRIGGYFQPEPVNPSPQVPGHNSLLERIEFVLNGFAYQEKQSRAILEKLNTLG